MYHCDYFELFIIQLQSYMLLHTMDSIFCHILFQHVSALYAVQYHLHHHISILAWNFLRFSLIVIGHM